jgi:hypothetical protein
MADTAFRGSEQKVETVAEAVEEMLRQLASESTGGTR